MPVPHLEIRIVQRSKGSSAVAGAASLFVEALQRESYIEYLLDVLLYGTPEEKKALVVEALFGKPLIIFGTTENENQRFQKRSLYLLGRFQKKYQRTKNSVQPGQNFQN